ncbi:hypothetical protein KC902_00085 [Candidatus Kaiserbacteria bacterium]|nr:hypothetical protein [Candidatus Kaiserbacteria bacterium]
MVSKRQKLFLILFLILLVSGLVDLYWKHSKNEPMSRPIYELDGTKSTLVDGAWSVAGQLRTSPIQNNEKSFASSTLGISLHYPADWLLFEQVNSESGPYEQTTIYIVPEEPMLQTILASRSNLPSESPLSVVIEFNRNVEAYSLMEWLLSGHTNYDPEQDPTLTAKETEFNGIPAMKYNSDFGLRETDYIAFLYKDWTVLISSSSDLKEADVRLIIDSIRLSAGTSL